MSIYPRILLGDLDLTAAPFLWEFGSDFGGPEVVYETLLSLLRDGSSVSSNRVDNRTMTFTVIIEAADFLSLAQYEALLVAECDKQRNTLTFEPGDAFGPPTVFQTFRADARMQRDDDLEQAFTRRWSVTLQALPWPRSATETVTLAESSATETVLYDGTSATGWRTYSPTGPPTVSAGTLVSATNNPAQLFRLAQDTDLSAGGYVAVTWQASAPVTKFSFGVMQAGVVDGTDQPQVAVSVSAPWTTTFVRVPAGMTTASLQFLAYYEYPTTGTLTIDKVSRWNALPLGTSRQKTMSLIPGGSVRTQGTIAVESPTTNLGTALVYTYPSGFGWTPPLRPWLTASSAVTGDATLVSGARNALATLCVFTIPALIQAPGSYLLMARMKQTTTATTNILFSNDTYMSGAFLGDGPNESVPIAFTAGVWQIETLGRVTLPASAVGPSGSVTISIQRDPGSGATVEIDEAWLFHESGDLTVVNCGTGAGTPPATPALGAQRLWVDAPTLESPQGGVFVGVAADRSDSYSPGAFALARAPYGHNLPPDGVNVFVVTTNATDAAVSSTHFKTWHTHAAE